MPWLWSGARDVPVLRQAGLDDDAIRSAALAHNRRPGREMSSFFIIYESNWLLAGVSIA